MSLFKRVLLILFSSLFSIPLAFAESFIINHIQVEGLQRINESTVLNYLPVHVGQTFNPEDSATILQSLYNTGFFSDVQVLRNGNTLVVKVMEQPVIGLIQITGNKAVTTKKLKEALQNLNIEEGQVFNSAKLNEITQGLKQQYNSMGYYAVQIDAQVTQEVRDRVAINIHVIEGPISKIHKIEIVGNNSFPERVLLKNFKSSTPGIFSFFTHSDRYSDMQLDEDLQNLQMFYLDHGYLQYHLLSQQAVMSPDHKSVDIVITITEGPQYRIRGYQVVGPYADDPNVQHMLSVLHEGDIFSRSQVMAVNHTITDYFENKGYAFPQININYGSIDQINHTVFLIFNIQSGHQVYVRNIVFSGNHRTEDSVLRSEMRQMEASTFSLSKVNESKRQLANLPYLQNIQVQPVPVPGRPDEVDLNYHVDEVNAGRASVQGGYSDVEGFLYGASVSEPNFMGTGKLVSIGFTKSQLQGNYYFSYNNPFYTVNGISRGFDIYYTNTTPNNALNLDTYTTDDFGGDVHYGIPLSDFDTLTLGYGYDNISLYDINPTSSAPQVMQFSQLHPSPFNQFNLTGGLTRSTLDQAVFPTSGSTQTLSLTTGVPVLGQKSSIGYYKGTYTGSWYWPLGAGFIISPHASLGYGGGYGSGINSALPFYDNFYAGGIDTLPGFAPNSLGPLNPNNSNNAMGGNTQIIGGINFIFPNHISDKLRTAIILDAGNVFQTVRTQYTAAEQAASLANGGGILSPINYEDIALKNMRVSTGLMISWYSPLGPIDLSLAVPIVQKKGDDTSIFGFSFGTTI